jgi:carbon monoxide dehydrogenase subunit G
MKITGSDVIPFPVAQVWDALLDPQVLVATIPGCERLATTDEHTYDMTVTAGVAAIKGTYTGTCALSDLVERHSLVMRLQGSGAPGTIDATVQVYFDEAEPDHTKIDYDADAVVGGMVGGVGQRMLTSVSRRMAAEFFGNVAGAIAQPPGPAPAAGPAAAAPAPGAVFTAPAKAGVASREDFVKGIAVGAGLVLLGVLGGALAGSLRRRR